MSVTKLFLFTFGAAGALGQQSPQPIDCSAVIRPQADLEASALNGKWYIQYLLENPQNTGEGAFDCNTAEYAVDGDSFQAYFRTSSADFFLEGDVATTASTTSSNRRFRRQFLDPVFPGPQVARPRAFVLAATSEWAVLINGNDEQWSYGPTGRCVARQGMFIITRSRFLEPNSRTARIIFNEIRNRSVETSVFKKTNQGTGCTYRFDQNFPAAECSNIKGLVNAPASSLNGIWYIQFLRETSVNTDFTCNVAEFSIDDRTNSWVSRFRNGAADPSIVTFQGNVEIENVESDSATPQTLQYLQPLFGSTKAPLRSVVVAAQLSGDDNEYAVVVNQKSSGETSFSRSPTAACDANDGMFVLTRQQFPSQPTLRRIERDLRRRGLDFDGLNKATHNELCPYRFLKGFCNKSQRGGSDPLDLCIYTTEKYPL